MDGFELSKEEEEELVKLSRYNRMHFYTHFWEISKEHQRLHDSYLKSANDLFDSNERWQCEEYYSFGNRAQKSGYVAIVFAVMFIEGAIYNFGAIYLGDNYIRANLDKLSLLSKISVVMRLVTGKDIDSGGQAYEHLKSLIKYRNSLVHPKSHQLPSGEELMRIHDKGIKEYYSAIES